MGDIPICPKCEQKTILIRKGKDYLRYCESCNIAFSIKEKKLHVYIG